jgi:DNA-binding MarR family transcriptional regulator
MNKDNQYTHAGIADALHSASIHLLRRARRDDPASGVAPAQLSALSVLVYKGALTLGQLASAEQVSPPSMSRTIDELEGHGLVRRARDKHDRRVVYAVATREGARLLRLAKQRRLALIAEDISKLTEAERETLAQASQILVRMMAAQHTEALNEGPDGKRASSEAE